MKRKGNQKNRTIIKHIISTGILISFLLTIIPSFASAQPIFIYRTQEKKLSLLQSGQLNLRGEFFASFLFPCNFPSFNDLSGNEDRWNFGFQNHLDLTPTTTILVQLITHDDGQKRTKFDWHFSLWQNLGHCLILIIGHDSNHDCDRQSFLGGKPFYLNRNYVGLGLKFASKQITFEPFTWFFHHTNQRSHLDFSGEKLRQEYGFRLGLALRAEANLSCQTIFQSDGLMARGQSLLADLILRIRMINWLELSLGAGLWKDLTSSRLGNQKSFHKIIWGIAIPF